MEHVCNMTPALNTQHAYTNHKTRNIKHDVKHQTQNTKHLQAEELNIALESLGKIYGAVDMEEMLDVVFRDFCIGK